MTTALQNAILEAIFGVRFFLHFQGLEVPPSYYTQPKKKEYLLTSEFW